MALVCCHANLLGPIIFILDSDITRQYYTPPSQNDLVSRGSGWNSGNCSTSIKCKILQNVVFSCSWLWLVFGSGKKKKFVKVISVVVVCSLFLIFFLFFRHHEWSKGHAPTNYAKWRTATTRYTVCNENKIMMCNRPSSASHSCVTKPSYWRARDTMMWAFWLACPSESLALQHGSSVLLEWLLAAKSLLTLYTLE